MLELLLRDLADVAEQLRGDRALRVVAQERARELDARELVPAFPDVVDDWLVDADLDRDRRQRVALALGDPGQHLADRDVHDARKPLQLVLARAPRLRQVGRVELESRAGTVVDERHAVPVEDHAARRFDADRAQLVVLCDAEVLVACQDLERPQPQEERAEDDERDRAEDRDAERQLRRQTVRLLDPRIRREERAASQAGAPRARGRSTPAAAAASSRASTPAP